MRKFIWRVLLPVFALLVMGVSMTFAQDPVSTEQPTEEPTPEVTEEVTPEATEAPIPEATEEVTPEATQEPTPEATATPETENVVRVDGSALMVELVNRLISRYTETTGDQTLFEVVTQGPNAAFESLCSGALDVAMSTRFITDAEAATCDSSEIEFVETIAAWEGLVALASPQIGASCLDLAQLDALYGIAAEGTTPDAIQLNPAGASAPLTLYSPQVGTLAYDLIAAVLPSGELRADLTFYDSVDAVKDLLTGETAGVALLTLREYSRLDTSGLTVLEFRNPANDTCYNPSLENIETRNYLPNRPLLLYTTLASLEKSAVRGFLEFVSSEEGAAVTASELDFTPASSTNYGRNINNISEPITGRTFSRANAPIVLAADAAGEVVIGGDPLAISVVNAMTEDFTTLYTAAKVTKNMLSNAAGWDDLCAKTVDVLFTTGSPTPEQEAACQEAGVETFEATIGTDALVVVVAARHDDLPACVTYEALVNAFAAPPQEGEEIPQAEGREVPRGAMRWNDLDPSYPDLPLHVFLPGRSSLEVDWLLSYAGAADRFSRSDLEDNVDYDPASPADKGLYRAAAVANFDGYGLAILRWRDYITSERAGDLRPLEVDGGEGCVAPSLETISDGSYPLTLTVRLVYSQASMGEQVVGAFMWNVIDENALFGLAELDLPISKDAELRAAREEVFSLIEKALQIAAEQAAQAAEEATPEATEAATQEATAEATPQP